MFCSEGRGQIQPGFIGSSLLFLSLSFCPQLFPMRTPVRSWFGSTGAAQQLSSPPISLGSQDRCQPLGSQLPNPSPVDSHSPDPGLGQPRDPGPVAVSPPGLYFGTVVPECCPGHPTPNPERISQAFSSSGGTGRGLTEGAGCWDSGLAEIKGM